MMRMIRWLPAAGDQRYIFLVSPPRKKNKNKVETEMKEIRVEKNRKYYIPHPNIETLYGLKTWKVRRQPVTNLTLNQLRRANVSPHRYSALFLSSSLPLALSISRITCFFLLSQATNS